MSLNLLLDTHALLWTAHQPASLSKRAFEAIEDGTNRIFVSAVSAFEIAIKNRKGKLEFTTSLARHFIEQVTNWGFQLLPISVDHAQLAGNLVGPHKDPWDRILAAQAQIEGLPLVTQDAEMPRLGAETFW